MKRVLVITYYWPPAGGAGVQRWVKFTKYLREFGWEPVIYTPSNPQPGPENRELEKELPEGIEVIKTKICEPYAVYRKLTGGASTQITELSAATGKVSWKKRISLFIRGNFFIPDPRCGWVRPSVTFLKKYLKEHPVDAVVTTGPPHSMHLIGLALKRRTGIPWVADFRDPWTKMFYFKDLRMLPWAERRHERLEQQVIDEASAVISVASQVRDDFRNRSKGRVELITNGYDSSDFDGPEPDRDTAHWRVVQTGNIGADGNPRLLWKILGEMAADIPEVREKLQIRLCGKLGAGVAESLEAAKVMQNTVLRGYVSHDETVLEQRSADLLLLPLREGVEGGKIVPGKTFEYLAARRRILGIGDAYGSAAQILSQTGSGKMLAWDDEEGMRSELMASWKAFCEGSYLIENTDIEQYSRRALSGRLAQLLDSLV